MINFAVTLRSFHYSLFRFWIVKMAERVWTLAEQVVLAAASKQFPLSTQSPEAIFNPLTSF